MDNRSETPAQRLFALLLCGCVFEYVNIALDFVINFILTKTDFLSM